MIQLIPDGYLDPEILILMLLFLCKIFVTRDEARSWSVLTVLPLVSAVCWAPIHIVFVRKSLGGSEDWEHHYGKLTLQVAGDQ